MRRYCEVIDNDTQYIQNNKLLNYRSVLECMQTSYQYGVRFYKDRISHDQEKKVLNPYVLCLIWLNTLDIMIGDKKSIPLFLSLSPTHLIVDMLPLNDDGEIVTQNHLIPSHSKFDLIFFFFSIHEIRHLTKTWFSSNQNRAVCQSGA